MASVFNLTQGRLISSRVTVARTPWKRLIGFLDRREIAGDEGIWFERCSSVHTVGMRARIDLVFLDRGNEVVATMRDIRPNRPFLSFRGACSVLEFGTSHVHRAAVGDTLAIEIA